MSTFGIKRAKGDGVTITQYTNHVNVEITLNKKEAATLADAIKVIVAGKKKVSGI